MKPYYDHGGIQIHNCDCRDILPSLKARPSGSRYDLHVHPFSNPQNRLGGRLHLPMKIQDYLANLFVCAAIGLGAVAACNTEQLPADAQIQVAEAERAIAEQEAMRAEALAEGDAAGALAAEARIAELEAGASKAIAEGAAKNVRSVFGLFGLSGIVPGGPLIENAIASLAYFAFRRPRQHAARIVKGLNPFDQTLTPYDALRSLGALVGVSHSSDATAKVFDPDMPAKAG